MASRSKTKSRAAGRAAVKRARRRLKRDLVRAGAAAQLEAVKAACSSPEFADRFTVAAEKAGDAVNSMREVRRLALAVLDEMKVPHRAVMLTFSWDPSRRKLGVFFRMQRTVSQVARASLAAVRGEAPQP